VQEFLESESIEELADILEVIDAICAYKGVPRRELLAAKETKRQERGGFVRGVVLVRVDPA
jgi:predicted house-cleaning noncanonical NTP pyrophosphatase (MazG superfamily)